MGNKAITAAALTKYYGRARGIDGLNLEVETGDFFGFIGPNGAGKSTTIRTLLGLISPTSGKAQVLGMDIEKNNRAILERVGYLPSDASFYRGMRVREILKLSADLRKKNCDKAAAELCDRLQLDRDRKVEDLSFGNRKKVGIVCALQHDPELLILDEPTGGLDPLMQHEFFSILRERNEKGVTVFLSSHILSEIQRHCSRAAVIREGKIIACDSMEKLAESSARRVTLRGDVRREDLPECKNWTELGDTVSFLWSGEVNDLIRALTKADIRDMTIAEPDLEEIVLHFYEKGGEQA
ncbi:MAG: ABC transporter ATP-binding protein [Clostridiales bacterium]|nr:ABC transporter ATP-binding protein [Clostridiales bacterium]